MKDFLKKRVISYGIALVAVLIVHMYIQRKYGHLFAVNDDILFRELSNGALTGAHETRLVYIYNILGYVFKGLYTIWGTVEWYSVYLIAAHYIAWILLTGELGSLAKKMWQKGALSISVVAVCIIVDMERALISTFTSTAACFGAVGMIFLVLFLCNEKATGYGVIAVICCVLSFVTRYEVFLSFIPLMGILVLLYLGVNRQKLFVRVKRIFPYVTSLVILIVASWVINFAAYSSPEWKDYLEFNQAEATAHDYYGVPDYNNNKEAYANIGWDYDDFYMMKFAGTSIFKDLDTAKMHEYVNIAGAEYKWQLQWKKNAVIRFLENYWNGEISALKMIALGLCVSLGVYFACNKCAWGLISVVLGGLYHIIYGSFLIYKGRFPERISHVILLAIIAFYVSIFVMRDKLLANQKKVEGEDNKMLIGVKLVAFVAVFGVCFLLARDNMKDSYKTVLDRVSNLILLREYCNSNPENTYCVEGSLYGTCSDFAFGEGNPQNVIVTGSWLPKSPHHKAWRERVGADPIFVSLAESDNVYLIRQSNEPEEVIEDFYADNNMIVSTEVVDILPGGNVKVVKISVGR